MGVPGGLVFSHGRGIPVSVILAILSLRERVDNKPEGGGGSTELQKFSVEGLGPRSQELGACVDHPPDVPVQPQR